MATMIRETTIATPRNLDFIAATPMALKATARRRGPGFLVVARPVNAAALAAGVRRATGRSARRLRRPAGAGVQSHPSRWEPVTDLNEDQLAGAGCCAHRGP